MESSVCLFYTIELAVIFGDNDSFAFHALSEGIRMSKPNTMLLLRFGLIGLAEFSGWTVI